MALLSVAETLNRQPISILQASYITHVKFLHLAYTTDLTKPTANKISRTDMNTKNADTGGGLCLVLLVQDGENACWRLVVSVQFVFLLVA